MNLWYRSFMTSTNPSFAFDCCLGNRVANFLCIGCALYNFFEWVEKHYFVGIVPL